MNLLDVNLLIALFARDHVHHAVATRWFEAAAMASTRVTVPDLVWVGFVRIVTNSRISATPVTFEKAWEFVSVIRRLPQYVEPAAGGRTIEEFARLSTQVRAAGNLVTDAYIAAAATTLGAAVVTFDRDFRKFDEVRVVEPA